MEYIVTGGAGFIGSAVVWELNNRGIDDILIVDNLGHSDKWQNLSPLKYEDYLSKEKFLEYIEDDALGDDIKTIIHLGACSSTTEKDANYLIDNNYAYSKTLAKYAIKHKIRFVYASSAATYGNGSHGYVDNENEIEALRPLNMYGYSKQMFDLWIKKNEILDEVAGLKFTNIFGPNEWHKDEMKSVVCKAYKQVKATGKAELFKSHKPGYKNGEQKRDFLYIKDAVKMIMHFVENESINGLYNIGSGRAETWNSLVNAVFKAIGKTPSIKYIDMPEELRSRYQYYTKAEISKIQNSGYDPKISSLEVAVEDYVVNYLLPEKHLGD
jgi:ADP-L-glycero-D-manno-heptose 6-epimerase